MSVGASRGLYRVVTYYRGVDGEWVQATRRSFPSYEKAAKCFEQWRAVLGWKAVLSVTRYGTKRIPRRET